MNFLVLATISSVMAAPVHQLVSNTGGAIPAGLQAPSISGFTNPVIHPSNGGLAVCVSGVVPVTASTDKGIKLNYETAKNESEVIETLVEYHSNGSPLPDQINGGNMTISGDYDIYATLCVPANNTRPSKVQLLTHGLQLDRNYWDFAPGYSYVDTATAFDYATFFYDRLGVGMSSKPPSLEVQSSIELEVLNALAMQLRNGTFSDTSFSTIIGTGHSFGSILTQALTASYPDAVDAAILTGYTAYNGAMTANAVAQNFDIATQNQPYRFSGLDNGYVVADTIKSLQIGFFRAPGFDPAILSLAEATKQTVTDAEMFTIGTIDHPATNFTGPVAVVNGENDWIFCFGNCSYPTNLNDGVFSEFYPNTPANKTGSLLLPVTGHAVNLHYTAEDAYLYIQNFLLDQGF